MLLDVDVAIDQFSAIYLVYTVIGVYTYFTLIEHAHPSISETRHGE